MHAKTRAQEQGIPFTLKIENIVIPKLCPLLGIELFQGKGAFVPNSPSLDRILPSLGYVPENIWVISHRANMIKNASSFDEFEMIYVGWKTMNDGFDALLRS